VQVVLHQTFGFATLHGSGSHRAAADLEGRLEGACLAQIKRNKTDWYCPCCAHFQANQKGADPCLACTGCGQPRPATLRAAAEAADAVKMGLVRSDVHTPARPLEPGSSDRSARYLGLPFSCSPARAAVGARASRERDAIQFGPPAERGGGASSGGMAACCLDVRAATAEPVSPWRRDEGWPQVSVQPAEVLWQQPPLSFRHTPPLPQPQVRARPALGDRHCRHGPSHAPLCPRRRGSRKHAQAVTSPPFPHLSQTQPGRCVDQAHVEPLQTVHHARLVEAELTCARLNPYRLWAEDVSEHNGAKRYACTSVEGMAAELASTGVRTPHRSRPVTVVGGRKQGCSGLCDAPLAPRRRGKQGGAARAAVQTRWRLRSVTLCQPPPLPPFPSSPCAAPLLVWPQPAAVRGGTGTKSSTRAAPAGRISIWNLTVVTWHHPCLTM
jgi:hypothetical protein